MSGYILIGKGVARQWSNDASDVEPWDTDLLAAAREHGLYDKGQRAEACDRDGNLIGEGWLSVVGDHVEESDLDGDPAVIAYCVAP